MILDDQEYLALIAESVDKNEKAKILEHFIGSMNLTKFLISKLGGEITFNTEDIPHYSELPLDYIHDEINGIGTLKTFTQ